MNILEVSNCITLRTDPVFGIKNTMVMLNEDSIEDFIRENKSKFEVYRPPENHSDRFFFKLNYRIKNIINILPYLIRVAVATVIVFISSLVVWNNYIRKDRDEISLGQKITLAVEKIGARPE